MHVCHILYIEQTVFIHKSFQVGLWPPIKTFLDTPLVFLV